MQSSLYLAVVGKSVFQASRLIGLLSSLHGLEADGVRVIAGPMSAELINRLRAPFPNTYFITNLPVPASERVISLPGADISSFSVPRVVHVTGVKGGVGKTTLTLLLAYYSAHELNLATCVIDRDEQAGSTLVLLRPGQEGVQQGPLQVTTILGNVRFVPNVRGRTQPIPEEIVGGILGAQIVICDHGNRARAPRGTNSVLVVGVGKNMLDLLSPLLPEFGGVIVINPSHGESKSDVSRMKNEIQKLSPSAKMLALPTLYFNPWEDSIKMVPLLARSCSRELRGILNATETTSDTLDDRNRQTGTRLGGL